MNNNSLFGALTNTSGGFFGSTGSAHNQQKCNLRRQKDIQKLVVSSFEVELQSNTNISNVFHVIFDGPKDSPYEDVSTLGYCRLSI